MCQRRLLASPNTSPQRPNGLLEVTITVALVAGGHELEEQVGGLGLERYVANLVDDQKGDAAKLKSLEHVQPLYGLRLPEAAPSYLDTQVKRLGSDTPT